MLQSRYKLSDLEKVKIAIFKHVDDEVRKKRGFVCSSQIG